MKNMNAVYEDCSQPKKQINKESLWKVIYFLEGYIQGKGNLGTLGTVTLDDLIEIGMYLNGNVGYENKV